MNIIGQTKNKRKLFNWKMKENWNQIITWSNTAGKDITGFTAISSAAVAVL